jgi:hypothetical protein
MTMETEAQTPERPYTHAIRSGAIVGAITTTLTIIFYIVSIPFMGSLKFVLLIFATYIGYLIYAGIDYRNSVGGYLSFGKAFVHGFMTLVTAGVISTLFGLLLYQVIDTELAAKMVDTIITNTEDSMRSFGAPEDQIESRIATMREEMPGNFTALGQVKNFFTGLIWNAVIVLLTSLFVRKSEPVSM